jgi:hypothetical protein
MMGLDGGCNDGGAAGGGDLAAGALQTMLLCLFNDIRRLCGVPSMFCKCLMSQC